MFEEFTKDLKMPEDLKKEFLSNLLKVTTEAFNNAPGSKKAEFDFNKFITDFISEYSDEIYDFHLKEYSPEELWQSILISQSDDFKRMMNFQVRFQQYLGELMINFQLIHEEEEYLKETANDRIKEIKERENLH